MSIDSIQLAGEVGETLFGDDEVHVTLVVVFRDNRVTCTETGVFEV